MWNESFDWWRKEEGTFMMREKEGDVKGRTVWQRARWSMQMSPRDKGWGGMMGDVLKWI
jgi:hypothetical protein